MDLPGFSGKNLYLFSLLVLPGFIAQSVYDLFIPHGERDASANLFLGVAYGTVNLALTWPLVYWAIYAVSEDSLARKSLAYGALPHLQFFRRYWVLGPIGCETQLC